MKRQILIIALLSGALIFLVRLFEARFLTGELPTKLYVLIIGVLFLTLGIGFGLYFTRRETVVKVVEKEPEVKGHPNDLLTTRETELLTLLAKGLSNREISERIFVSEHTVKKHLSNLYGKLEVTRRTQAISKAKQLGIISV